MAIYRLDIQPVTRSAGRTATAAAAYRAGERIRDERTRRWFDHSSRRDVTHAEIILPSEFATADIGWARDRTRLWNAAEHAERRRDSRVAREYQVALPHELNAAARIDLARTFSRLVADRYQVAVDLAIHEPRPGGDPRNFHAHLLTTTRALTLAGLGAKTGLDMASAVRRVHGLPGGIREMRAIRAQWATLANEALSAADLSARVDHRPLEAQGLDRKPRAHLPWAAYRAERQGLHSDIAERVREGYRLKVQARRLRYAAAHMQTGAAHADLEEIRRLAREDWLRFRDSPLATRRSETRKREIVAENARGNPDHDHSL